MMAFQNTSRYCGWSSLAAFLFVLSSAASGSAVFSQEGKAAQVRSEFPYRDGTVVLTSVIQERISATRYRAKGHVVITFQDTLISGDEAEYDEETRDGTITGQVHYSQKQQWLNCTKAEFNFNTQTGIFYDASGFTDREFFITGRTILKTGKDTYKVQEGIVTACKEKRPKWSFAASSATVLVDRTTRLHRMTFKIKGIPVFYAPYFIVPMERKTRSSGFIPFHYGNSTSKGRTFSEGYYQTLGESADLLVYGDYFSERGLALGGIFRVPSMVSQSSKRIGAPSPK
jgi:LPS-assembly protein